MNSTDQKSAFAVGHDLEKHGDNTMAAQMARRLSASGVGDDSAIEGQIFSMSDIDPALDAKMRLVNEASQKNTAQCACSNHV